MCHGTGRVETESDREERDRYREDQADERGNEK
jgi:hypothetical protein